MGDFALALIQILRWECRLPVGLQHKIAAVGRERAQTDCAVQSGGLKSSGIGNLEHVVGGAQDAGEAGTLVEDVLDKSEAVILLGVIVNGIGRTVRTLDTQAVFGVVARDEIIQRTGRAAIVEGRRDGLVAAAIDADLAALLEQAGLGLHVDDAAGDVAIFGRQCAVYQLDILG